MLMVAQEALVLWNSTTNTAFSDDLDLKLWAVIKKNMVIDGWLAVTEIEAQIDNPGSKIVLVKPGDNFYLGMRYNK
jgi:hypothetical protein